ncbi:uncharacterized protein UBRO_21046 [Ustilago bromivora]|uniref:DDE Tnp4 domain-containing protein n=1 Tax=Ustilago bromivora TaxID=307758 RepID=A0A1K0FXQ4_9BASI|nr:uncharacterized protein UBRO_21046 [Ustilago bromivora]
MVCTSDKQHLLDNIETAIMHLWMVESKMQLDLMDVNATSHPNYDLEESDDDMFDHAVSFTLIRTYNIISQSRYTVEHLQLLQRRDPLINMLDRYAVSNRKLFRGAICMSPDAFQALTYRLSTTNVFRSTSSFWHVQQQVAWTDRTIAGLYELNSKVVTFATEDGHAKAKAWVADKSGVEEWSRGWLVVDGTHINLAWKPALNACKHYSYKGDYTFNIALVFLPHSLHIVKLVVGHTGSSHDVQVWASGSGIIAKPCLHLDEGEFVWVDAGNGYSSYTVGPYSNTAVAKSRDLHYFNYSLSCICVKAEHDIAYLKNCFQCLMGFRGNLCYDQPDEVAEYLKASENLSEAEVLETTSGMEAYQQATKYARIQQRENQQQYKQEQAAAMEGMSQNQVQKFRQEKALDLREEMLTALFASHGCHFEDTTAESQRMGMTTLAFTKWQERQD